jgi:hypothetical protein
MTKNPDNNKINKHCDYLVKDYTGENSTFSSSMYLG